MKIDKEHHIISVIALTLVLSLVAPCTVYGATNEAIAPCASDYLSLYSAYVYVTEKGEVQVWFEVMGTGDMDEIGALSVRLYESSNGTNWTWVDTIFHEESDLMLFEDDYYVSSHVSFQGSTNKSYKAYVCVWAGKNGNGDTRYFWAYEP